ncbi:ATP synthase subunit O, mitochondrial-like isoform X1 [Pieris brassicae]|nr:ATP synthase subunit O, mitochondrial-like isoform X1 [Pieris brassicae]
MQYSSFCFPLFRNMCIVAKSTQPPISIFGIEGRYVSALYSAALQMKQMEQVEKHLQTLQKELVKPKIIDFIESSMISAGDKAKLLKDVGEKAGMPPAAINFLVVVAENGRLKMLRRMITLFSTVMVAHRNEALCEVITAKPLDESTRKTLMEALKKFVKGKNITLTEKVDSSIIGGLIVGIEDKHIDMSISRKVQMYTDIIKQSV